MYSTTRAIYAIYYLGVGSGHADDFPVQLTLIDHGQGAKGLDLRKE